MHEVSLAEEILHIVESSALSQRFNQVQTLTLEIGDLAAVETEALEFALIHMAPGTILEGARIQFVQIQGSAYCDCCAARVPIAFIQSPCPRCGHLPLSAIHGEELRVRDLEVN